MRFYVRCDVSYQIYRILSKHWKFWRFEALLEDDSPADLIHSIVQPTRQHRVRRNLEVLGGKVPPPISSFSKRKVKICLTDFRLTSLKKGKLYSENARLGVLFVLKVSLNVVRSYFLILQRREMDFTTLRLNEHFQNKVVYLFLGVRDKSLYLCIKVAYFKYRSRSLVLIFYISFRKAGNRRRYSPTRYLHILGTFQACFSGFDCIPLINIFW